MNGVLNRAASQGGGQGSCEWVETSGQQDELGASGGEWLRGVTLGKPRSGMKASTMPY